LGGDVHHSSLAALPPRLTRAPNAGPGGETLGRCAVLRLVFGGLGILGLLLLVTLLVREFGLQALLLGF